MSEIRVKGSMFLAALLVLALVLPVVADEPHAAHHSWDMTSEIPVGNWTLLYSWCHLWADFGFDNATIGALNLELNTSQTVNVSVSRHIGGGAHSTIYQAQVNNSVLRLNKSDLLLDDWLGVPERSNYSSYNSTHLVKRTYYIMRGPEFLIHIENVGSELAVINWRSEYTLLCHGVREAESYVFPARTYWTNTTTVTDPERGVWQDWGYYAPELSNPFIDAFFRLWVHQLNRTDADDRWIFSYDPTEYIVIAFENGLCIGIVIGLLFAIVAAWFGQKLLGVES